MPIHLTSTSRRQFHEDAVPTLDSLKILPKSQHSINRLHTAIQSLSSLSSALAPFFAFLASFFSFFSFFLRFRSAFSSGVSPSCFFLFSLVPLVTGTSTSIELSGAIGGADSTSSLEVFSATGCCRVLSAGAL